MSYCHVKTAKSLILCLVFTLILFHEVKFRTSKKSCTNSVFMPDLEDLGMRFDGRGNVFGFMKSTTPKPCVESSILSAPATKCANHTVFRMVGFLFFARRGRPVADLHIFL